MALTNATTLADYGAGIGTQGATLKVDATNKRVGVGTDSPAGPEGSLQVGTGITFFGNTGIVSAIGGKFSGDFTVGGTLTYEDVANIDAVGIITAQSHVSIADSILHTGDTDTSIRFPATGTFTVETNGSEAFRVDSSQRLLVNTTSEMETFGSAALQVATAAGGTLVLGRNDTSVSVDNGLGAIYFDTKAGGSYAESAVIAAEADADQGSGDYPSRLVFKTTADGAGSVTERLRIDSSGTASFAGDVSIADKIIHTGDTNTAIRFPEADTFTVETGGSERVRVTGIGSVGIGDASPENTLTIKNIGSFEGDANSFYFGSNFTGTGTKFIGSGKHAQRFFLNNASSNGYLRYDNTGTTGNAGDTITWQERFRVDSSGRLLLGTTTEGEAGADEFTVASSGDCGITIRSGSSDKGKILFSDATSGDGEHDGYIQYEQNNRLLRFGTATAEQMRIDSSGRLMVGATTAATSGSLAQFATFVLRGDTGGSTSAGIINLARGFGAASMSSGNSAGNISFSDDAGLEFGDIGYAADGAPSGSSTPGKFVLKTTASGATTPTERLRVTSEGELLILNSGNRFLSLDRTNASSGSGEFNVNVESDSQASISYDDGAPLVIGTSSSPRTQAGFTERLRIDENGNLKLADSTLGIPASGSPPETFFVGRKAAIRSVTVTTTLNGSGEGTFDLGRIHYNDDESFEIFMSICINNTTTLRTSYCKAFCQKVRGTGLTDFFIDRQDSAHSGFSVSSLSSGTAQGVSGHGLNVNVTGGTASTEYRITALIHSVSKNDLY